MHESEAAHTRVTFNFVMQVCTSLRTWLVWLVNARCTLRPKMVLGDLGGPAHVRNNVLRQKYLYNDFSNLFRKQIQQKYFY